MSYDTVAEETGPKYPSNLPVGKHKVALKSIGKFPTQKHGDKVSVELLVLESSTAKVGETYGDVFFYQDPGYGGKYARQRLRSLGAAAAKILGLDPDDEAKVNMPTGPARTQGSINISNTLGKIIDKKGFAVGFAFDATTVDVPGKDGAPREKPITNTTYAAVMPQTKEDIVAMRKRVEEDNEPSMLDGI